MKGIFQKPIKDPSSQLKELAGQAKEQLLLHKQKLEKLITQQQELINELEIQIAEGGDNKPKL